MLAFIASKPVCGIEIFYIVHREFNVLLNPGAYGITSLNKLKDETNRSVLKHH
ncbi:hypothetical protein [Methanosarcina sp.]|uniref:hypothetical protein n=1 Tax=Methanosarcina sp. TaxID=2213 RepID=UPI002AB8E3AC|nr:hypothetical protein [Methanosarcina sp.]MDY9926968.1 hypothetical protein [Methanosarcina sp.]